MKNLKVTLFFLFFITINFLIKSSSPSSSTVFNDVQNYLSNVESVNGFTININSGTNMLTMNYNGQGIPGAATFSVCSAAQLIQILLNCSNLFSFIQSNSYSSALDFQYIYDGIGDVLTAYFGIQNNNYLTSLSISEVESLQTSINNLYNFIDSNSENFQVSDIISNLNILTSNISNQLQSLQAQQAQTVLSVVQAFQAYNSLKAIFNGFYAEVPFGQNIILFMLPSDILNIIAGLAMVQLNNSLVLIENLLNEISVMQNSSLVDISNLTTLQVDINSQLQVYQTNLKNVQSNKNFIALQDEFSGLIASLNSNNNEVEFTLPTNISSIISSFTIDQLNQYITINDNFLNEMNQPLYLDCVDTTNIDTLATALSTQLNNLTEQATLQKNLNTIKSYSEYNSLLNLFSGFSATINTTNNQIEFDLPSAISSLISGLTIAQINNAIINCNNLLNVLFQINYANVTGLKFLLQNLLSALEIVVENFSGYSELVAAFNGFSATINTTNNQIEFNLPSAISSLIASLTMTQVVAALSACTSLLSAISSSSSNAANIDSSVLSSLQNSLSAQQTSLQVAENQAILAFVTAANGYSELVAAFNGFSATINTTNNQIEFNLPSAISSLIASLTMPQVVAALSACASLLAAISSSSNAANINSSVLSSLQNSLSAQQTSLQATENQAILAFVTAANGYSELVAAFNGFSATINTTNNQIEFNLPSAISSLIASLTMAQVVAALSACASLLAAISSSSFTANINSSALSSLQTSLNAQQTSLQATENQAVLAFVTAANGYSELVAAFNGFSATINTTNNKIEFNLPSAISSLIASLTMAQVVAALSACASLLAAISSSSNAASIDSSGLTNLQTSLIAQQTSLQVTENQAILAFVTAANGYSELVTAFNGFSATINTTNNTIEFNLPAAISNLIASLTMAQVVAALSACASLLAAISSSSNAANINSSVLSSLQNSLSAQQTSLQVAENQAILAFVKAANGYSELVAAFNGFAATINTTNNQIEFNLPSAISSLIASLTMTQVVAALSACASLLAAISSSSNAANINSSVLSSLQNSLSAQQTSLQVAENQAILAFVKAANGYSELVAAFNGFAATINTTNNQIEFNLPAAISSLIAGLTMTQVVAALSACASLLAAISSSSFTANINSSGLTNLQTSLNAQQTSLQATVINNIKNYIQNNISFVPGFDFNIAADSNIITLLYNDQTISAASLSNCDAINCIQMLTNFVALFSFIQANSYSSMLNLQIIYNSINIILDTYFSIENNIYLNTLSLAEIATFQDNINNLISFITANSVNYQIGNLIEYLNNLNSAANLIKTNTITSQNNALTEAELFDFLKENYSAIIDGNFDTVAKISNIQAQAFYNYLEQLSENSFYGFRINKIAIINYLISNYNFNTAVHSILNNNQLENTIQNSSELDNLSISTVPIVAKSENTNAVATILPNTLSNSQIDSNASVASKSFNLNSVAQPAVVILNKNAIAQTLTTQTQQQAIVQVKGNEAIVQESLLSTSAAETEAELINFLKENYSAIADLNYSLVKRISNMQAVRFYGYLSQLLGNRLGGFLINKKMIMNYLNSNYM